MIRTLAVSCSPILFSSKDDGKTLLETASDEVVMDDVCVSSKFCLLLSLQNHWDLFLKALDDALKQFNCSNCIFQVKKMPKSAKAKVDDLLARECQQLCKHQIRKIHAVVGVLIFGTKQVSTECSL